MEVEKAIEFILAEQAKLVGLQHRTERKVDALTKVVGVGMKMLAELREANKKSEARLARLERQDARHEERFARYEERFARYEERFARYEERFARNEQKIERLLNALLRRWGNGRR
jgi:hypothetical protein